MSRLCRFFLILIFACAVVGCSEPGDEVEIDFMWAKITQQEYEVGKDFTPMRDLRVFTSYQGDETEVTLDKVTIKIAKPPYDLEEVEDVKYKESYTLEKEGTYLVIVEYVSRSTISPIKAVSPPDVGAPEIIIKWE